MALITSLVLAFIYPRLQIELVTKTAPTHDHKEHHSDFEFNSHDEETASHNHEHSHGPGEPIHSHDHKHSPKQVTSFDINMAYFPFIHQLGLSSVKLTFSLIDCELIPQGYLKEIFRPPIASFV